MDKGVVVDVVIATTGPEMVKDEGVVILQIFASLSLFTAYHLW